MQNEQWTLNGASFNKNQRAEQILARDDTQRLIEPNESSSSSPLPERCQVLIIGAGLAGLAAAERLHAAGFRDVLLLEAQSRMGGRVHTIGHSKYLLELGAQWLHGADHNPLYQWLSELDMLDDFQDASLGFAGKFYTSARAEIEPKLVSRVLETVNASKFAQVNSESAAEASRGDSSSLSSGSREAELFRKSASEMFVQKLDRALQRDELLRSNSELAQALLQWFLRYETIENGCDSMEEVSIASYTDWTDLGEGTLLNFRRGYSSLLAHFCANFPANKWLHLGKQVLNVELKSDHDKILVRYRSTSQECRGQRGPSERQGLGSIECDHVIVTASLGFLKQHLSSFFTPPLPEVQQRLIKSIGFGTVNKIILQFGEPFWQAAGIKLVWRREDEQQDWWRRLAAPWARDIISFDAARRQPNLLIGWIGGEGAKQMELEEEGRIGEVCLELLERFLPEEHARPTRLLGCLCSRWHSNPFTRGSYSFQSMSSLHLDIDQLHEPIYSGLESAERIHANGHSTGGHRRNGEQAAPSGPSQRVPRIMFAGEATAGTLYSTTHGAVISGWREADRLADHLAGSSKRAALD